jgi:hypothetical protein
MPCKAKTESEGQLSKHDPVWGRIRELHAQRFGRESTDSPRSVGAW